MNIIFCKHCGKEIDEDSKYCRFCSKEQYISAKKMFMVRMINDERFQRVFVGIMGGFIYGSVAFFVLQFFLNNFVSFGLGLLCFIVVFITLVLYKENEDDWKYYIGLE